MTPNTPIQIVHHLLAIYGTGGGSAVLQKAFDHNVSYQKKARTSHSGIVTELLEDYGNASRYLGKGQYYPDFLRYFQREIGEKGWQEVLKEYLFQGANQNNDLFARLFAGKPPEYIHEPGWNI